MIMLRMLMLCTFCLLFVFEKIVIGCLIYLIFFCIIFIFINLFYLFLIFFMISYLIFVINLYLSELLVVVEKERINSRKTLILKMATIFYIATLLVYFINVSNKFSLDYLKSK